MGISSIEFNDQLAQLASNVSKIKGVKNLRVHDFNPLYLEAEYQKTSQRKAEFRIVYSQNYQAPQFLFKLFNFEIIDEDGLEVESWKLTFDQSIISSSINQLYHESFQVSLRQEFNQTWNFIHPCDTDEILQSATTERYLIDWFYKFGGLLIDISVDDVYS